MVELERQKGSVDEELATLQQLLNEAHDEAANNRTAYQHQLAKVRRNKQRKASKAECSE